MTQKAKLSGLLQQSLPGPASDKENIQDPNYDSVYSYDLLIQLLSVKFHYYNLNNVSLKQCEKCFALGDLLLSNLAYSTELEYNETKPKNLNSELNP